MQPSASRAWLARQWVQKAQRDLRMAEYAVTAVPTLSDMTVFHAQQAAEKALSESVDNSFSSLQIPAGVLTPYVDQFRYPGPVEEPTPRETAAAIELARDILAFATSRLPESVRP